MAKCTICEQTYEIEGILFDKDGTLVDFRSLWMEWAEQLIDNVVSQANLLEKDKIILAETIGFQYNESSWDPKGPLCIGSLDDLNTIIALHLYKNNLPWNEALEITTDALAEIDRQLNWKESIKPVPGLRVFLEKAIKCSLKLGVVTSDNHDQAKAHLNVLGIDSYFKRVIGHDQVKRGKPFPDMVYKACGDLAIAPERTLIIGDSNGDMILGKKSETLACIGIVSEPDSNIDHLTDADHVIRNYQSITIEKS